MDEEYDVRTFLGDPACCQPTNPPAPPSGHCSRQYHTPLQLSRPRTHSVLLFSHSSFFPLAFKPPRTAAFLNMAHCHRPPRIATTSAATVNTPPVPFPTRATLLSSTQTAATTHAMTWTDSCPHRGVLARFARCGVWIFLGVHSNPPGPIARYQLALRGLTGMPSSHPDGSTARRR